MAISALVFDAYGTLFDVHSVVARCEQLWPGQGQALSQLWRSKQLEYTWLRSLMGRYADFNEVTAEALDYATAALSLPCGKAELASLMDEYRRLSPFPDTRPTLQALNGQRRAILSNGAPDMLHAVVDHAGLRPWLDAVLSVDPLRIYKPHPSVYELAVKHFGLRPAEIGFVSSNGWDAAGAKSFGFKVFWINRTHAPIERLGLAPDHVITSLAELPPLL